MKSSRKLLCTITIFSFLTSCASNTNTNKKKLESYLFDHQKPSTQVIEPGDETNIKENVNSDYDGVQYLNSMRPQSGNVQSAVDLKSKFSSELNIKVSVEELTLKDYLHYVLGEMLGVSYILGEEVKSDNSPITLNLQEAVSQQKLFTVTEELLTERDFIIRFEDGIFYIHKSEGSASLAELVYGYGKNIEDIPNTSSTIVQFVPFDFGLQTSLTNSLRQIVKVNAQPDFERSMVMLQGKKREIVKALEFIQLMDQPAFKGRHIGVYKGTYVSTEVLIEKLPLLLKQEGISVDTSGLSDKAVSIVTLESIGTIVLFANNQALLERVNFWAKQIDQPPSGNELQYFLYNPQFARATDLGESLQVLISGGSSTTVNNSTSADNQNKRQSNSLKSNGASSLSGDLALVIDERANSLIFNTTGDKYRQLLPLIKRLDVMPKQVILEVMIAEVKLTDVYKQGVDFVLTNQGDATKIGGFNLSSGSDGLSYLLSGARGSLTFNLLQTNSNVNVLSRPSLLVRDGVTANITVGDEIPTVGQIITDPVNGSQTSVVYRKTGVELKVKPTINARGVVIMEIDQKISNQATGEDSVAGSPIIFERSISTEVVAESGQTILLGGLISENRTINDSSVPFFSSIPLLGSLFDSTSDNEDKTELVVLVTPKIVESSDEWQGIKAKFANKLTILNINQ